MKNKKRIIFFYGWAFDLCAVNNAVDNNAIEFIDYKNVHNFGKYNTCLIWSLGIKRFERSMEKQKNIPFKQIIILNSCIEMPRTNVANFIASLHQDKEKTMRRFYKLCFYGKPTAFERFSRTCLKQYLKQDKHTLINELETLSQPFNGFHLLKNAKIKFLISQKDLIIAPHNSLTLAKTLGISPQYIDEPHFALSDLSNYI